LFNQAKGLVRRSSRSGKGSKDKDRIIGGKWPVRVLYGTREIQSSLDDGFIRVLAADANTADGVIPTLVLVDELHRHKSAELYTVLRDGLGPRDGRLVCISTAGDSDDSPLGQLRAKARSLPGLVRVDAYHYVNHDGFAWHEWALDEDDDVEDMDVVKTANPAPWHLPELLGQRFARPSTKIWEWKRFACGIWTFGEESAIGEKEWRACADPAAVIPGGSDGVIVGVDIGRRHDTTAVIAVWRPEPDVPARVEVIDIIVPPGDGTATPEDRIWEAFEQAVDKWPNCTFVFDPKLGGDLFAERLEREYPNARVSTFEQQPGPLALMAQQLSDGIAGGRIAHPDDTTLNRHVLAGAARQVGEKWRFAKPRRKDVAIDGLIALAMAYSVMLGEAAAQPDNSAYFL
jgi:phage terminase large subunit-like protein